MPPKHEDTGKKEGKHRRLICQNQPRTRTPPAFLPPHPRPPDKKPATKSPTGVKLPHRRSGKRAPAAPRASAPPRAPAPRRATAPPHAPAPSRPRSAPVHSSLLNAAAANLAAARAAAAVAQGAADAAAVVAGAEARARRDFAQRQPPPSTHPDDARSIEAAFAVNTAFPPLRLPLPDDPAAWVSPVMKVATAVAAGLPADAPAIMPFPVRAKTFQVRLEFALMTQGGYTSGQRFLAAGTAGEASTNPPPTPDDKDDFYDVLKSFFD